MFSLKVFLTILLTFLNIKGLHSLRAFDIRWQSINCTIISKPHFGFFNCFIKEWTRNRGNYVTIDVQFNQNINKILLDFKVLMPSEGKKDVELIKFRSDGCYMSKRKSTNPVVNAVMKQLLQSGNFSGACPLEANTTYSMEKISLIPDFFPGYTPEMNFSIKFSMFTGKIKLLTTNAFVRVLKKK